MPHDGNTPKRGPGETRGRQDDRTRIGRLLAHARKRRGRTQKELADRIPCSLSLVKKVESGHKAATESLIAGAARVLHVDVTEITGQPYRGADEPSDRIHATIPEIRRALVIWDAPPDPDVQPRPLADLRAESRRATQLRQEARYSELGAMLPALIIDLTITVHTAAGKARMDAFGLLALAYSAADSMAYKLGYLDLAHMAVERVGWAAAHTDDPLMPAVAEIRRSMSFLSAGEFAGGQRVMEREAGRLQPDLNGDQPGLAVYGTMHLRAAVLAARDGRAAAAWSHMDEAHEAADRIGHDTGDYALLFGPSNAAIHDVAVAVELGDAREAVRRGGDLTLPDTMSPERTSHHNIDMGKAWLWSGDRDRALSALITAERIAPQRTRYHPMARDTAGRLLDAYRRIPDDLRGLADRMGIV